MRCDIVIPLRSGVNALVKPYPVAVALQDPDNGEDLLLILVGIAGEDIRFVTGIGYDYRDVLLYLFCFLQFQ